MKLVSGKQNKSVASPINAKTIPIYLGRADDHSFTSSILQKAITQISHTQTIHYFIML